MKKKLIIKKVPTHFGNRKVIGIQIDGGKIIYPTVNGGYNNYAPINICPDKIVLRPTKGHKKGWAYYVLSGVLYIGYDPDKYKVIKDF